LHGSRTIERRYPVIHVIQHRELRAISDSVSEAGTERSSAVPRSAYGTDAVPGAIVDYEFLVVGVHNDLAITPKHDISHFAQPMLRGRRDRSHR
jgi:hypothetical protein